MGKSHCRNEAVQTVGQDSKGSSGVGRRGEDQEGQREGGA